MDINKIVFSNLNKQNNNYNTNMNSLPDNQAMVVYDPQPSGTSNHNHIYPSMDEMLENDHVRFNKTPYANNDITNIIANMQSDKTSSGVINAFSGTRESYNNEYFNRLLRQFDKTFLSKLVDLHNAMSKKKVNLNDIDSIFEFLAHYKQEMNKSYIYSLLFPERTRGMRIPTKFPIPSLVFHQKSNLTISPNSSGNWYLQWCPQTLLTSGYTTANTGNLLLDNSSAITGSVADTTTTNYTSIIVDRLQTTGMIQAYRLVSASIIITYCGSVDAHSGVLGGGVDISHTDSLQPDTGSSVFSVIDDKIWNLQTNPYEGLRLIYFPKDYNDLNFIRPDVGSQSNGLSTCIRFLLYGQNMPSGGSVRVDLYRNIEAIPHPNMADFVNIDFYKNTGTTSTPGEPALEAGSKIADSGMIITKLSDEKKLERFGSSGGTYGYLDPNLDDDNDNAFNDAARDRRHNHGVMGSILDVAGGLGKTIINEFAGNIPFVGTAVRAGTNWLGDKIHNIYN